MRKSNGAALGVVLSLVALVAVLGFALSTMSVSRMFFSSNAQVERETEEAARSLMEVVLQQARQTPSFAQSVTVKCGRATAQIRFQEPEPPIPRSLNNLVSEIGKEAGDGRWVPAGMIRLVIQSRCQRHTARYEAMLHSPTLPYAIASCGSITSHGSLVIASLTSQGRKVLKNLDEDPLGSGLPADIISNSSSNQAISLNGSPTTIFGDLRCCGKAELTGADVKVAGELWEDAPGIPLPTVTLDELNPVKHAELIVDPTRKSVGGTDDLYCPGDLTVTEMVKLQGNRLFVAGSLTIEGEARGFGTIVVGHQLNFHGQFQSDPKDPNKSQVSSNKLGVYARGGISLEGSGTHDSYFRGVLMSDGLVQVKKISVIGSLVALGENTQATTVQLSDCILVQELLQPSKDVLHFLDAEGGDFWQPGRMTVLSADQTNLKFTWTDANNKSTTYDLVTSDPSAAQNDKMTEVGLAIGGANNVSPYMESDDRYRSFGGMSIPEDADNSWHWLFDHIRWISHQKQAVQSLKPAYFVNVNERLRPAFFRKIDS